MGKQYDWSSRCCLSIKEGFEVASCWQIWVFVLESCFEATTTAAIFRNGANNLPRPMTDWMENHGVVAWFFHATWGFCIAILTFCRAEPTAQALLPRIPTGYLPDDCRPLPELLVSFATRAVDPRCSVDLCLTGSWAILGLSENRVYSQL